MILKPCNKPGCIERIPRNQKPAYCTAHRRERNRLYDKTRSPQIVQFYQSAKWKQLRLAVLVANHYLCEPCKERGELTAADTVHHVIELKEDWSKRLERDNLQAICRTCHEHIHDRLTIKR